MNNSKMGAMCFILAGIFNENLYNATGHANSTNTYLFYRLREGKPILRTDSIKKAKKEARNKTKSRIKKRGYYGR